MCEWSDSVITPLDAAAHEISYSAGMSEEVLGNALKEIGVSLSYYPKWARLTERSGTERECSRSHQG